MTATPPKLRRIALCHQPEQRYLVRAICRELHRRLGSQVYVYCAQTQQASFYDEDLRLGTVAQVKVANLLHTVAPSSTRDRESVLARARAHEKRLGTTLNQVMMADRHFGRAYSLGGFYHPRSYLSENQSYEAILDCYNRQLDFWLGEFEAHDFTLVLFPTVELGYLAEAMGVEMRAFIEAGHANLYLWTTDRYDRSVELDIAYRSAVADAPMNIFGTYGPNEDIMARIDNDVRLATMAVSAVRELVYQAYWRMRGYDKARSTFLSERLAAILRLNRQMREVRRLATTRLTDMAGERFVFYPLHEEPETVLTIGSPERFDQLGAIASVARDLPAGVRLVVKETYFGVGRRPENFYRQIVDFKNVVFMDMSERGVEVARAADAIVTIRGTVGQEGAILGKPVILLARRAPYACIGHVRPSRRQEELRPLLDWALSPSFDRRRALLDGARYCKALEEVSVDLEEYSYLEPQVFAEDAPRQAADALVRSVAIDVLESPRRELPELVGGAAGTAHLVGDI